MDRGAPLRWVSQYPGEDEIVMPPLSNLEVVGDARMHVHTRRAHAYEYIYMHIYT